MLPQRVVFVIASAGRGGAQEQVRRLAPRLQARGWEVAIACVCRSVDVDSFRGLGVARIEGCISVGRTPSLRKVWRLSREIRLFGPDVVVTLTFPGNVIGRIASRLAGCRRIVSSIRSEGFGKGWMRPWLERLTAGRSETVVVNSTRVADMLVRRRIFSRRQVVWIPNGLTVPPLSGDKPIADGMFRWVAVGRLVKEKGYHLLLDAFGSQAIRKRARLTIVGGGDLFEELSERIVRDSLGDRVTLAGDQDDVEKYLRSADGYVLSSVLEGLPNAAIEAAALCLPVVATDVGGVREIVEDGVSGRVVIPKSSEALAAGMLDVMTAAKEGRAAMGKAGREVVVQKFALEKVVAEWDTLLRKTVAGEMWQDRRKPE